MICVHAICEVKPQCLEEFLKVAAELVEASRKDAGNISYHLAKEVGESAIYVFVEQWKDDDALDLHIAQPHFTQAVGKFGSLLASPLSVHKLETV